MPDFRLDRHFHSGHRFLFHTETATFELVCTLNGIYCVGALDGWGVHALAVHGIQLALANASAAICGS